MPRRWFNPYLPQMLQIAIWLFYFQAFWALLEALDWMDATQFYGSRAWIMVLLHLGVLAASILSALGLANERSDGYRLARIAAFSPFVVRAVAALVLFTGGGLGSRLKAVILPGDGLMGMINLAFEVALIVLVWHQQSREHAQRYFTSSGKSLR